MTNDSEGSSREGALLLVAAKSLQAYVLGSDKLREMVGATQLIEDFCSRTTAQRVLDALQLGDGEIITGAAGQITVRFPRIEAALTAAAWWPWFASRLTPGLEVHVGVAALAGGYLEAVDACQAQITQSRNRPPASLPAAAPVHQRNPRSGLVAVGTDEYDPDRNEGRREPVVVDRVGQAKRWRRRTGLDGEIFDTFGLTEETLAKSFAEIAGGERQADRSYLAIIHADGNGFGQMLRNVGERVSLQQWEAGRVSDLFQTFSGMIRDVGRLAVKDAVAAIEPDPPSSEKPLAINKPWLPIVQAGDDLTVVMRADLAAMFLESYLQAFERHSAEKLAELGTQYSELQLPKRLTAGGAIVYCKMQYPFSEAYALCESLAASRAKGRRVLGADGQPRSALALHRITASTCPTEFSEVLNAELLCSDARQPQLELTAAPWFLNADEACSVEKLDALVGALRAYPAGARRQLLTDLRSNRVRGRRRLERMLKVGEESDPRIDRAALQSALAGLHGGPNELWRTDPSPDGAAANRDCAFTAIADALTLIEVTRRETTG